MKVNIKVVATLDTLQKEKNYRYHELLMRLCEEFEKLEIPVILMTGDTQEYLDKSKRFYNSKLEYISGEGNEIYLRSLNAKNHFGESVVSIQPYISIYHGDHMIFQVRRINDKSTMKILSKTQNYHAKLLKNKF